MPTARHAFNGIDLRGQPKVRHSRSRLEKREFDLALPAAQFGRVIRSRGQHDRHRNIQQEFARNVDS
jgi:hypothetical protein